MSILKANSWDQELSQVHKDIEHKYLCISLEGHFKNIQINFQVTLFQSEIYKAKIKMKEFINKNGNVRRKIYEFDKTNFGDKLKQIVKLFNKLNFLWNFKY